MLRGLGRRHRAGDHVPVRLRRATAPNAGVPRRGAHIDGAGHWVGPDHVAAGGQLGAGHRAPQHGSRVASEPRVALEEAVRVGRRQLAVGHGAERCRRRRLLLPLVRAGHAQGGASHVEGGPRLPVPHLAGLRAVPRAPFCQRNGTTGPAPRRPAPRRRPTRAPHLGRRLDRRHGASVVAGTRCVDLAPGGKAPAIRRLRGGTCVSGAAGTGPDRGSPPADGGRRRPAGAGKRRRRARRNRLGCCAPAGLPGPATARPRGALPGRAWMSTYRPGERECGAEERRAKVGARAHRAGIRLERITPAGAQPTRRRRRRCVQLV